MKRIQELCAATTLLFVFSLSTLAGEIHTNALPPPPTPSASVTAAEPDEATTDGAQSTSDYETLITEVALNVLQLFSVV
jgi:hypothetical protein